MKKNILLFMAVLASFVINAQSGSFDVHTVAPQKHYIVPPTTRTFTSPNGLKHHTSSSRAASLSYDLYYPGIEESYATAVSKLLTPNDARYINHRVPADTNHFFDSKYGMVFFDNLYNLDSSTTCPLIKFDRSRVAITIDSLFTQFVHVNVSGQPDTIIMRIFDYATTTGVDTNGVTGGTLLWSDTVYTDTSLSPDAMTFTSYEFYPHLSLPRGATFIVQADYYGDLRDEFILRNSYSDNNCTFTPTLADTAYVQTSKFVGVPNSLSYSIVNTSSGPSFFFSPFVAFDINGDRVTGDCEHYLTQNLWLIPQVTYAVDLSATNSITNNAGDPTTTFCPGEEANVYLNIAGATGATTVSWSPTTGVDNPASASVKITVPSSTTTYYVTITSGADTYIDTVRIVSNGINVNAGADQSVLCGVTANLNAAVTGVTAGVTYKWSNNVTTGVNPGVDGGVYTVTVTNSSGCSATDNVTVTHPGVTQTVAFAVPSPICASTTTTNFFPNTSLAKTGWNFTWTVSPGGVTYFTEDGNLLFTNPGPSTVSLVAEQGGCRYFTLANVTVLAAGTPSCRAFGVQDLTFGGNVAIFPNPNTGTFELNVEGATESIEITIFDAQGQTVYSSTEAKSNSLVKTIDMNKASKGIYFVKVQSGVNVTTKKLVIN